MSLKNYTDCKNVSGVKRIWVNDVANISAIEPAYIYTDKWRVDAITHGGGAPFKLIYSENESCLFEETPRQTEHGHVYDQVITGWYPKHAEITTKDLDDLVQRRQIVLFEDYNGAYRIMGSLDNGAAVKMERQTNTISEGGAGNAYTFNFSADKPALFYTGDVDIDEAAGTLSTV
jgi:hypothetical protein